MPPGGIKFKADLQAQCLCLQLERLPTELLVGSETYPFHNLYWCCGGVLVALLLWSRGRGGASVEVRTLVPRRLCLQYQVVRLVKLHSQELLQGVSVSKFMPAGLESIGCEARPAPLSAVCLCCKAGSTLWQYACA